MTDLERRVRESLGAHAEEVDTTVPVAARASAAARKRRTGWVALGAAAAVAAVAVVAVVVERAGAPDDAAPPVVEQPTSAWRTESWGDISITVPAEWGWGTTPDVEGDRLVFCGGPSDPAAGYVGRPISLTDVCMMAEPDPQAPYAWLGSELPVGTSEVGNGYTQETVRVGDTAVTVATVDPALRARILASATVGGPCAPRLDAPPEVGTSNADLPAAESMRICAYRDEGRGDYRLVAAEELDAEAAAATEKAILRSPVLIGDCLNAQGGEWVTLTARGDGWTREYVVDLTCPGVTDSLGQMHRLTPAMADPWAVGALPYSLYGPTGGKGAVFEHFIGPQG